MTWHSLPCAVTHVPTVDNPWTIRVEPLCFPCLLSAAEQQHPIFNLACPCFPLACSSASTHGAAHFSLRSCLHPLGTDVCITPSLASRLSSCAIQPLWFYAQLNHESSHAWAVAFQGVLIQSCFSLRDRPEAEMTYKSRYTLPVWMVPQSYA